MSTGEGASVAAFPLGEPVRQDAGPAVGKTERQRAGQLYADVHAALENCPETFDRGDICRVLGREPNRGSLYRVLQELIAQGMVTVETPGEGTIPTKYRKR